MPAPRRRRQRLWRDPLTIAEADIDMTPFIPDVVEFTVSDRYLNKPFLYPRQATLLKLIFLQLDQLTQYDYDVIGEWGEGFTKFEPDPDARLRGEQSKWQGTNGIQPDVLDRAEYLKANGYHWFREVVSIIGRRGSKGHIGGIAGAYVLWYYIQLGNPQRHYGVDPAKKLAAFVFGGKKEQAKANQWADFTSCISWSNCFTPFVSNSLGEIMTIFAKSDFAAMEEMETKGIPIGPDPATFLIEPKESTPISARGPASFCLHFDEMAHVVKGVAKADAKTVYDQAKPSLDQFGKDAFLYEGSSTWQMTGQFYENYQQATLLKPDGLPARPEMIMWQLTSWDPYIDWERAKDLKLTATSDRKFFPLQGAVSAFDEQMEREQQANAETFAVERLSHWQASLNVYLRADKVDEAFGSWGGREIVMQSKGLLGRTYRAHGDPSKTNANFGFAIAHTEGPDENGLMHVVFDVVHAWMPRDYPNGIVLYVGPGSIEEAIWQYTQDFMPGELTFDQFNCLDGDTKLFTEAGLMTLRELAGEMEIGATREVDLPVQSRGCVAPVRLIHRRGPSRVRHFTTKLGYSLSATPEHRLWVRKAKVKAWHRENEWEWLTADQIETGDWLCLRRNNLMAESLVDIRPHHPEALPGPRVAYPDFCTEGLGFVLGAMVSEGWVSGSVSRFSNNEADFLDAFLVAARESFGCDRKVFWVDRPDREEWAPQGVVTLGKGVSQLLTALGAGGRSQAKRVPWVINCSPRSVVAAFLRALFEGDGGIAIGHKAGEWVHFTTTSEALGEGVQQLLLGLGVFSTLWSGRYSYKGEQRRQWRVKISGIDLLDFEREVGFVSERKIASLRGAVALVTSRGGRAGRRSQYQRHGDEYWVRVVSVEDREGVDCYDISVPGPESFLANGIVSHNSISVIQSLQQRIGKAALPKGIQVYERTANKALNWTTYETFKAALNMNLVHIPQYELAQQELTFLEDKGGVVDHPSAGPVQTKDVADCYDDSMEVLTERGWMSFADVPTGIKVATRSAGGVLEYQEPTDYIARHHQGVMYEYDSHRLNFSVTPRHRMLVQRDGGVEFIEAQHLAASQYRIPKTSMVEGRTPNTICFDTDDLSAARKRVGGRGGSRVGSGWTAEQDEYLRQHYSTASMTDLCAVLGKTRGAIYNRAKPKHLNLQRGQIGDRIGDRPDPLPETKVEDFAAFLGIWLAEGRKVRDKRGYAVKITQTKPEGVEWIDNLFDRLSWPVRRTVQANGETVWTVKSYGLREYLRACQGEGHELRIPDEVFTTWTRQEMGALLEGLLVGDGCWSKQAGRHVGYYSTSKQLVDDVQRLLLHLGYSTGAAKVVRRVSQYRANHDLWYVGVNTSQHSTLYIDRLKQVPYDGMVYCLTVPNSTLLVRRNGVPMWSGNCIAIVTHALLGDQMAQYIGKALGDLPLSGSASGGFDPYAHQADNSFQTVQEQFAQFSRGAAMSRAMGAPRRRR